MPDLPSFSDPQSAERSLARLTSLLSQQPSPSAFLTRLFAALSDSADPDRALVNFERFIQDSPGLFVSLENSPRLVEILLTLFAGSQFLAEILLSSPQYVELLADRAGLARPRSPDEFYAQARSLAAGCPDDPARLDALRQYQRRELLRIGACDLLDLFDLPAVTRQLSNLAEGLVRACLEIVSASLDLDGDVLAVIAMGKLGGQELNYSSDIDLIFLERGGLSVSRRAGEKLIQALSKITAEGFLYRVDMRLRPWGRAGVLVPTLDGYLAYLQRHAQLWEKQALLKARVIAGDEALGKEFLRRARPFVFGAPIETLRAGVFAMKQRTEDHLRRKDRVWGEVKLGVGSIRDIEFIAQFLQLAHGYRLPEVLTENTMNALDRLYSHRLLSAAEYRALFQGYVFLRTVEHYLQMMHYQQTNRLPREPHALEQLARRLGFSGPQAASHFVLRYHQHGSAIRAVFLGHVGDRGQPPPDPARSPADEAGISDHLLQMHPSYAAAFSPEEIAAHAELANRLDDENLVEVRASSLGDGRWQVTIVAYDYPGELSAICGLLFASGLDIQDGKVFTYEPPRGQPEGPHLRVSRPKIVDVFTVKHLNGAPRPDLWSRYQAGLDGLLRLIHQGKARQARVELAKRVALTLPESAGAVTTLYPIVIEIDNSASGRYTVLRIGALDTPGFLYELASALSFHKVDISRMTVSSSGSRLQDTLYVTGEGGRKITGSEKLRQLRAAIVLVKHFTHLLPHSPNPQSALVHFREFVEQLFTRPDWPDELASLERPEVLEALARLLGVSDFLWDDFLRMQHANLFPLVRDIDRLASSKSKEQLQAELERSIPAGSPSWRERLNRFKDREMFRADMRNILGFNTEFEQFSQELTALAEVIVDAAYRYCLDELAEAYGVPLQGSGDVCPLAVCALGKCGGRELGYASDIELLFVYDGSGCARGSKGLTAAEFYEKLVENFLSAIPARREGIFQIDLQLRPYGKAGSLAVPLESFRRYYASGGPAWAYERQALVKLRPIAGDQALGKRVLSYRDAFVYSGSPFDATAMRAMRERQIRHLVTPGAFNAKYSPGGLLDVEYLVQGLQITHGREDAALRSPNTRQALAALAAAGILTPQTYTRLRKAHTFLRWLIDSLRVVRGNAKDLTVPPPDTDEFAFLARRLRYGKDLDGLREELVRFTSYVQEAVNRTFTSQ